MMIEKLGWNFPEMAAKQNKKLLKVPLKDNKLANILWNDNAIDCFITENGKLIEGCCLSGPKSYISREIPSIFDKLGSIVDSKVNLLKEFFCASFK